jgi:hypothetical protein
MRLYIDSTMPFYSKRLYKLVGYQKSVDTGKKYDALLERRSDKRIIRVPFGDSKYSNYQDKTGLNLYTSTGDIAKRRLYRARHRKDLREGFYNPGYFSWYCLW